MNKTPDIRLINAFRYYNKLDHQNEAIAYLEEALEPEELYIFQQKFRNEYKDPLRNADGFDTDLNEGFCPYNFARSCRIEAEKGLLWYVGSEAEKYSKHFYTWFGFKKWAWCAAFIAWNCRKIGLEIPGDNSHGGKNTFAFCEEWQEQGKRKGWYTENKGDPTKLQTGDILLFDYHQTNYSDPDLNNEHHIGCYLEDLGNGLYLSAEGNYGNKTALVKRELITLEGWVRIPKGTKTIK